MVFFFNNEILRFHLNKAGGEELWDNLKGIYMEGLEIYPNGDTIFYETHKKEPFFIYIKRQISKDEINYTGENDGYIWSIREGKKYETPKSVGLNDAFHPGKLSWYNETFALSQAKNNSIKMEFKDLDSCYLINLYEDFPKQYYINKNSGLIDSIKYINTYPIAKSIKIVFKNYISVKGYKFPKKRDFFQNGKLKYTEVNDSINVNYGVDLSIFH